MIPKLGHALEGLLGGLFLRKAQVEGKKKGGNGISLPNVHAWDDLSLHATVQVSIKTWKVMDL